MIIAAGIDTNITAAAAREDPLELFVIPNNAKITANKIIVPAIAPWPMFV